MPITELPQSDIFAPLGSDRPFAATPGKMDVDHGSDSPVEKPSWWALTTAAFRNDNTVGSYSSSETRNSPTYQEEGFHPWESIKDTKYEAYPKRFADVRNTRASDDLKRQIDREEQDQKTLDAVPWYQSLPLHLLAGGLDLPSLIPGGAFVRSAQGGISIGRTALNVSLAAGVSSLAQETALQQSQATRPLSESGLNIGASVFLGGLLGAGGAKLLSRGEWNAAVRTVETGHGGAVGQVYDDVLGQLKATGMGDAEAQANASVVAARYATRAERLGAENAFDLYKNEGIAIRQGGEGEPTFNQSVSVREGRETLAKYGLNPDQTYKTREVAEALERRQHELYGTIARNDYSDKASNRIANWMSDEIKFEMLPQNRERSGIGWYSEKFQRALDEFGSAYPELKSGAAISEDLPAGARVFQTGKDARDFLTALIAVTSDGQKVATNFQLALKAYGTFRETGRLPEKFTFGGDRNVSMQANFRNLQNLVDQKGPSGASKFLLEERTVSDLRKIAAKEGIEFNVKSKADAVLPMSAIVLGPKLGAFYANLMGSHGYLTMDRWWSRTFNRYRGTLLPQVSKTGLERFRNLIGEPNLSDAQALRRTIPYRDAYAARGYKNGTEIEKAANTIHRDAFEVLEDQPFNASDREFMTQTVERAQQSLEKEGIHLSLADIQATLWYYEKRLYGELGARQTADTSYEEVAKRISAATRPGEPGGAVAGEALAKGPRETVNGAPKEIIGPNGSAFDVTDVGGPLRQFFQNPKGWETAGPGGGIGHPKGNITLGENKAIIRLFSTADRSTFMHEAGHLWLSELVRDARKNAGIKSDLDAVLKWFGVDDASKISKSHHEQWARGFEEYLRDGNAPSSALAKAFEAFKNWLTKIYGSIAQIHSDHVPISNEVRGVMDRMLATDTELAGRNAAGEPGLSSAGAAANLPRSIEENTIAGKAAQSLAAATGQLNPIMRALRSPSAAWREISQQLFETPLYLKKNFENVASDVAAETLMKEWNGGLAKAIIATKDAFEAYKKAGGEMARDEFRQAVGKAMRRGDASDDPHVDQVAKEWRAKVFDPLKDAAIKAGLLPEDVDVKTAASYFSRMWNRNKLIAREGEFKQIVRDWVQGQYQTWEKSFEAETRNKSATLEAEKRAAFEAERAAKQETLFENPKESAHDIANQVFNTLTGKTGDPSVRPEFITIKARGPLKERTFNIPDQLVEDFLEHDVEMVGRRYTRIMGADVELTNKFGSPDMADQTAKVHDDYAQLRNGITDEKQLTKLGNREKADIRDLEAVRDLLRGTGTFYNRAVEGNFNRIVNGANQFNYIRQMGEVVLASLTDVIRPAMVHGLMPFMGGLTQLATSMKGIRLSVAEAQLAGNVLERTLAHRMATIAEIIDPYSAKTPVEAMLRNLTEVGSKWNGIRLWTDGMKSFSSVLTQNRILKGVESFAGLKDKEKAYLAFLGVDESMAGRIAKEFAEHGETVEGVRVANTEKWDDPVVRRAYRAAINKDVDSIIVQKGVADTPLMANTPMGRAVLQFKSFSLASHQRILMRGLQEDQARLVGSIVAMTTMGMMMTWLKAISGNRKEDLEYMFKNPGWTIAEGLDRSGVLSVPVEAANAFEKLTHFNPIKTPMKAFDEGSAMSQKLQNRNELGAALGPSFGLLQDIGTAVGIPKTMVQGEEVTKGQERAASRLLPFRTYMGVRQLMDYVVTPPQ